MMNRIAVLTAALAIFLLNSSVEGIRCLQGQRVFHGGTEVINTLQIRQCSDSSFICHRYDITTGSPGASGKSFLLPVS